MIQTRPYHGFQIAISRFRSDKICYIILPKGLKEDGVTWMSTVEDATNEVVSILKEKGIPVEYVLDEGTHFSPIVPRLQAALSSLYSF